MKKPMGFWEAILDIAIKCFGIWALLHLLAGK